LLAYLAQACPAKIPSLICLRRDIINKARPKSFQKKSKTAGKSLKPHRVYKFGLFSLDATAKVLLKEGQPVQMTRKSVETLLALAENAGQVVPKEELLNEIWPDRVVDEANLTQNIAMVRRALGAERGTPAFIETFPGRGYRLTGPVSIDEPPASANLAPQQVELPAGSESVPAPEQGIPLSAVKPIQSVRQRWDKWAVALFMIIFITILAGAAGWWFWPAPALEPQPVFHITSFTRLAGKEWQPALSPDGKRAAFLWEAEDGQRPPEIRILTEGASSFLSIARPGVRYSSPAWAPDGKALAYLRIEKAATEVLLTALPGETELGQERLVARFTPPDYGFQYRLLDWSPDGQWLVVSHSASPDKPNGLYLVNVATGEQKPLTKPAELVGGDLDPRFSPDGKSVTFIRHLQRSHQELYAVPAAGGEPQPLTADGKQISSHDWLGDGSSIIFASDRSGEFRLWKLPGPASAARQNPQRLEIFGAFPIELSLARQAPRLVYAVQPQDRNIWRLDLQTKTWTRLLASSAQDASPQYSPDGKQICFRSDRTGEEQLWVSDAEGNHSIQITQGTIYPSVGHWSPDGRQVVFHNSHTGELYLTSLGAGGDWSARPLGVHGVHPVFSPDGQWIYAGTTKQIFKIPASGGAPIEVVNTGGFSLGLSHDGQRLYFMREVNDTVLWQVRTDTGELSRALDGILPACTSCWALTPTGIYYLGSGKESFDTQAIYFHRFGANPAEPDRLIIPYPEPLAPVGSGPFSLSPDLKHLLCVRLNPSNSDLMRVEPFR
jgi:Tol biopolymer transport system component/DNA-binding winged helix-turn-helix (wHTH) protein